jgi:hypothetical protein
MNDKGGIMYRLLIADDQVPDSDLSSEKEVMDHYSNRYQDSGFAAGFVFIYKLMNFLKSQGYEIDSANTPSKAIELAQKGGYHVIILDLGWWTIENMKYEDKIVLGWRLAEEMQRNSPAQILMFSNRFYEDQELAKTTAEMGCLPVYKSYDDACTKNLLVTIRWATLRKTSGQVMDEETKAYSFKMYKRLSSVLLGTIIAAVILLLFSVALAAANLTKANMISSVFGAVCTFMNGALYKYVSEYRKSIR